MFTVIDGDSADEIWLAAANHLTKGSATAQTSRAGHTTELLHVAFCLRNPLERWVVSRTPALSPAYALAEVIWILMGRNDSEFLNYFNRKLPEYAGSGPTYHGAYGFRLRHQMGIDQLHRAYRALKHNPNSRQVVLQFWDVGRDFPSHRGRAAAPDIPCNICSILKVRNRTLEWTQIMRSNDIFRGFPYNIIQFTYLQEIIAGWLGLRLGAYHHLSDSLHMYESTRNDVASAKKIEAISNRDGLAESYRETHVALKRLSKLIDTIVNIEVDAPSLMSMFSKLRLPVGWRNIAAVLLAEGLRKRGARADFDAVMEECKNALFQELVNRWIGRVGFPKSNSVSAPSK